MHNIVMKNIYLAPNQQNIFKGNAALLSRKQLVLENKLQ